MNNFANNFTHYLVFNRIKNAVKILANCHLFVSTSVISTLRIYKGHCFKSNVEHKIQEIIAFDMEGETENVDLRSIQTEIKIGKSNYKLLGVVEHQQKRHHFIAHALRADNSWATFDDLQPDYPQKQNINSERVVLILYHVLQLSDKVDENYDQNKPNITKRILRSTTA